MWEPKILESDEIQSVNFVAESSPGAGDGKGWRLSRNGDFQLGTTTCLNGEIFSPHGNVRVDSPQFELGFDPDKQRYLDEKHLREASITPARVMQAQMATHCDLEVVVRIDLPEGADPVNAEGYARSIRQIVMDTVNGSEALKGMRSGRITTEQTARVDADAALASRISALDVADGKAWGGIGAGLDMGKEYLAIEQPGGDVTLGRLGGKPITSADFKPGSSAHEFAGGLCRVAPLTANGKVPINNLPRPVDDDK